MCPQATGHFTTDYVEYRDKYDCADEDQQQLETTNPSSRQGVRHT
jgi:hypothetical protein